MQEQVFPCRRAPVISSSLTDTLHSRCVDITAAITQKYDKAILYECESGEDVAVSGYQRVLEKELPAVIKVIIVHQVQWVSRIHAQDKFLLEQARSIHFY